MPDIFEKLRQTTKIVVTLLVQGKFDALWEMNNGNGMPPEEMGTAIKQYGRILIYPPEEWYDHLDVVQIEGQNPTSWSVRLGLWTSEEGRSDLSIDLTLTESEGELMHIELNDIHVF